MRARASMEGNMTKDLNPLDEAKRILKVARDKGVTLRLIGGLAVRFHCHGPHSTHLRYYNDIDLFGLRKESKKITSVFKTLGYSPNIRFNSLYGATRLQFIKKESNRSIDVFLDDFRMEHTLNFKKRLHLDELTIPITDLLLTKLQIARLETKDVKDVVAILEDHVIGHTDDQETINTKYIAELCGRDWGLTKTVTDNLSKILELNINESTKLLGNKDIVSKIEATQQAIKTKKKKLRWKLRSLIGEKVKWYNDVEVGEGEEMYK